MTEENALLQNSYKFHTTELGIQRIKRKLYLETEDVVAWCKTKINSDNAVISRRGKKLEFDEENSYFPAERVERN